MNLATLPDDDLLLVLGFLGKRDLLRCRGVCRRLRDTALHPHLWRERNLTPRSDSFQLSAAVLRLVPCLGALRLSSDCLKLGTLLATTNCAISVLSGNFHSASSCVFLAIALARQETLGRLTSVDFDFGMMSLKKPELQLLLHQLLHTSGLTSVRVKTWPDDGLPLELPLPKAAKRDVIPASLRRLQYHVDDATMLPSYLQWHADTLQVVNLEHCEVPAGTATLLGSLPQLKKLTCPMMDNMEALLQCHSLKTLYLCVRANDSTQKFLPGAEKYLRQAVADRLETLTLEFEMEETVKPKNTGSFVSALKLVNCLAGPSSSATSALRSLTLWYEDSTCVDCPQPQLQPLAAVLHRLPNLVSLDLGGPPTADFLAALDGRVLPRLDRLCIFLSDDVCDCPHEWAHGPEPRDLLRKYPRLHLDLGAIHSRGCMECGEDDDELYGCEECKCNYCAENTCHDFVAYERTLFSHPEHEACNQKHARNTDNMRIVL